MLPKHLKEITINNGEYSSRILVNYGAALNSYKFKGQEFVSGYASSDQIKNQKYKGVVLAPFPNRLAKAKYQFKNRDYTLPINREKEGLALHGFLYNEAFEILEQKENEIQLQYVYMATKEGYPFYFTLTISYILLDDGTLKVETYVKNNGEAMPFGIGWHPYFQMEEDVNHLFLEIPDSEMLELDEALIPTGSFTPFEYSSKEFSLREHHFDNCFLFKRSDSKVQLNSTNFSLQIHSSWQEDYPYFQIYTPKDRATIALEPMSCAPNAFNNQMGLLILKENESKKFTYTLKAQDRI